MCEKSRVKYVVALGKAARILLKSPSDVISGYVALWAMWAPDFKKQSTGPTSHPFNAVGLLIESFWSKWSKAIQQNQRFLIPGIILLSQNRMTSEMLRGRQNTNSVSRRSTEKPIVCFITAEQWSISSSFVVLLTPVHCQDLWQFHAILCRCRLLISMEDKDILLHRITKDDEVIPTLDIKVV